MSKSPTFAQVLNKRQRLELKRGQLESERSTFLPHYRDLSDFVRPRRSRFYTGDVNKGDRRNNKIIDSTATMAERTLRSGMMSGLTSPARPWFRLTTPDPDLAEFGAVKKWLYDVQLRMSNSFLRSNIYQTLPTVYGDNGLFGTAPMSVEEDLNGRVFHTQSFPVGSYMISKNYLGIVDTFFREFRMTVRQVIQQFGQVNEKGQPDWTNISDYVKNAWDIGQTEQWVDVVHAIMPNEEYNPGMLQSKYKRFMSVYYEKGTGSGTSQGYLVGNNSDRMLSEKGYDFFPILCPRWEVTGEDVYGTSCPGMDSLGDVKQLQMGERRVMEAVDKMIRPPMTAPASMKNQSYSILPGDITFTDGNKDSFRPAHEVRFEINPMEMKQNQCRERINKVWFADLFLMLANSDRRDFTAREIEERHEEKLLALGPVLEQMNQDLLDPLVDITFDIHMRLGLIPPPPPELQGVDLKVEYLSVMAQAQKLAGIANLERFAGFAGQAIAANPALGNKVNGQQLLDIYGERLSIPPGIIRTDDEVAELEAQQMAAQQKQQQAQNMAQASMTAKNLSQAKIEDDNALGTLINQAQGG